MKGFQGVGQVFREGQDYDRSSYRNAQRRHRPRTSVVALVRHAIERKSANQEGAARDDVAALEIRMRTLERRFDAIDANRACALLDALGAAPDGTGGKDRAMD